MPTQKKFTERIDIPLPAGTRARAAKASGLARFDTIVAYCRRRLLDAIETDLKDAKREKAR